MRRPVVIVGVRRWAVVGTLLVGATAGVGTAVARWHDRPLIVQAPPPPPRPEPVKDCQDGAYYRYGSVDVLCDSRARIEVYPGAEGYLLYKCICPGRRP